METVRREGDATIHICSDCGGQIIGAYAVAEYNGGRRFYHPGRCAKAEETRPFVFKRELVEVRK